MPKTAKKANAKRDAAISTFLKDPSTRKAVDLVIRSNPNWRASAKSPRKIMGDVVSDLSRFKMEPNDSVNIQRMAEDLAASNLGLDSSNELYEAEYELNQQGASVEPEVAAYRAVIQAAIEIAEKNKIPATYVNILVLQLHKRASRAYDKFCV